MKKLVIAFVFGWLAAQNAFMEARYRWFVRIERKYGPAWWIEALRRVW